ncbi:MAG: copper chaperone CopZ [Verrucomicrobiales bacterium]|jgi:copper chaperone CopZ
MKTIAIFLIMLGASALAEETEIQCRLLGLFQPDRAEDLRLLVEEQMPDVALVGVDFATAIATFRADAENAFPNAKTPEKILEQLDQKLRSESQGTFEARPLSTTPVDKLEEVKIPILGLDCKGCSYGAYVAVYKIEGVEFASASFREGLVVARFDPEKTSLAALEEALSKKRISIKGKPGSESN